MTKSFLQLKKRGYRSVFWDGGGFTHKGSKDDWMIGTRCCVRTKTRLDEELWIRNLEGVGVSVSKGVSKKVQRNLAK